MDKTTCGIDVSKDRLDVALRPSGERFALSRTGAGLEDLVAKESALAKWFEARTNNARGSRKKMIVALARKLLIALWHFVRDGVVPEDVVLRPAH
jgi:hypothetical protein